MTSKQFVVHFDLDNAAFEDDLSGEMQRLVLRAVNEAAEAASSEGVLFDANGNNVGGWYFEGRDL